MWFVEYCRVVSFEDGYYESDKHDPFYCYVCWTFDAYVCSIILRCYGPEHLDASACYEVSY